MTLKCDVCGKFVSYKDLDDGLATHKLVSSDSEYSNEGYETLCSKHKESVS
jgi:hypothetical protein